MFQLMPIGDDKPRRVGSLCIAEVGRIIRELVGVAGCACRNGSDDFLAFLHPKQAARGIELAESIRARVAAYEFERDGVRVHPTIQKHHMLTFETGVNTSIASIWASITAEKPKASTIDIAEICVFHSKALLSHVATPPPSRMPMSPPNRQSTTASMRN